MAETDRRQPLYSNFGPLNGLFEQKLTGLLGAANGELRLTTVMTCYHALQIGLQLLDLPEGAKVLVPAVTFPACPQAVRHAFAEPVLGDVDPVTWQLTPAIARRVATRMKLAAVMPVAIYGIPVPSAEWDEFANETGIPVIIDAAAAVESQTIPQRCLVAHSLHATKPYAIGEGGLLVSRDPQLIVRAKQISNFGTHLRMTLQDGTNAKLSEYHAAVGLAQFARWQGIKQRRKAVFGLYRQAIAAAGLPLRFQAGIDDAIVGALMLQSDAGAAETIHAALQDAGIAAHRMYLPPLYEHPYFSSRMVVSADGENYTGTDALRKAGLMTGSEILNRSLFGLPFHSALSEADIAYVIERLGAVIARI